MKISPALLIVLLFALSAAFAVVKVESIPEGSRIYVAPMGGFETNLIAALNRKKVPVIVVGSETTADFEVSGGAESQKANWMRIWTSGTWRSDEKASIIVKNLHTDVIIYAYEVNKWAAWHGSQSAAEACAKHIKGSIVHLTPEELADFSAGPRAKTDEVSSGSTARSASETRMFIGSLGLIVDTRIDPSGAKIVEIVDRGSLGNVSGLHVGDLINSVNGKQVGTAAEFAAELSGQPAGSRVRLGYIFKTSALGWVGNDKVVTLQQQPETLKTAR